MLPFLFPRKFFSSSAKVLPARLMKKLKIQDESISQQRSVSTTQARINHPFEVQSHMQINPSSPLFQNQTSTEIALASISVFEFARLIGQLKQVQRKGWTAYPEIVRVESVADHSWRMGLLCMVLSADKTINMEKCMKFALIHDVQEVIAGDITPLDGVSEKDKKSREDAGFRQVLDTLKGEQGSALKQMIYALWREFEDKSCIEAKIVKDIDRYEMLLQAFEYEESCSNTDLSEFFANNAHKIQHPTIVLWTQELITKRDQKRNTTKGKQL